jgi:hypothetical protein
MISEKINIKEAYTNRPVYKTSFGIVKKVIDFIWEFDNAVIQDFYVGTTNYPEERIFKGHNVNPDTNTFIIVDAQNENTAKEGENIILSFDVNGGIEKNSGRFVYCYYIDSLTREAVSNK